MTKENVIDFLMYCEERSAHSEQIEFPVSTELEEAIAHLIHRLRELGPL